jgi:hypothetical protein
MEEKDPISRPPARNRHRPAKVLPYLLCLCLGALAVFLYFHYVDSRDQQNPDGPAGTAKNGSVQINPATSTTSQVNSTTNSATLSGQQAKDRAQPGTTGQVLPDTAGGTVGNPGTSSDKTGQESATPQTAGGCEQTVAKINSFYAHLDKQEYMKPFGLNAPSQIYFPRLIQKLIDNPPVVTRETDDLLTVLKNTAHFFRIIGKTNIQILKGILDKEKDSFEEMMADFYALSFEPSCLQNAFDIKLQQSALYDYAGFFLNTMGGRLYLFRRDSVSRMAVNYYAILIIDQANAHNINSHGIEIKSAVDSLITEIENSGNQLKLKDRYLDKLYEIKEKYMSATDVKAQP